MSRLAILAVTAVLLATSCTPSQKRIASRPDGLSRDKAIAELRAELEGKQSETTSVGEELVKIASVRNETEKQEASPKRKNILTSLDHRESELKRRKNRLAKEILSLEKDLAATNGLKVGDDLVFSIQGRQLATTVSNIRSVNWDNMQPNFYIILSPGALDDFPSTFMTSFYLERRDKIFLNDLLREYPTMTVIEVDAIIEQIKTIIAQVTMAIELVLVLILRQTISDRFVVGLFIFYTCKACSPLKKNLVFYWTRFIERILLKIIRRLTPS